MAGSAMAASSATMARTQTTSINVNPAEAPASACPAVDIGCGSRATFLPVGSIGNDIVRAVLAGRAIEIDIAPRIGRNKTALQIGPVPGRYGARPLHQRRQAFGG